MRYNELPMITELITGKTPCLQVLHSNFYNTLFFVAAFLYLKWYLLDIQFSSVTKLCPTLCNPMDYSIPGLPVHHQLPEFAQTHVHWVGDAIQSSHSLSSPSPLAFSPSQHRGLFQWVSSSHQVASFSISPSSECSGLISFRMDWLDLLAVQGTLKRLLQHHSSKALILWCSLFFMV